MRWFNISVSKKVIDKNNEIICVVFVEGIGELSLCGLTKDKDEWTIFKWSTQDKFQHAGYGRFAMQELLKYCVNIYGMPKSIKYIWNGQNNYVGEWLVKHFDAICCCPLSILKNNCDDDWESHIYMLDKEKVLEYFDI